MEDNMEDPPPTPKLSTSKVAPAKNASKPTYSKFARNIAGIHHQFLKQEKLIAEERKQRGNKRCPLFSAEERIEEEAPLPEISEKNHLGKKDFETTAVAIIRFKRKARTTPPGFVQVTEEVIDYHENITFSIYRRRDDRSQYEMRILNNFAIQFGRKRKPFMTRYENTIRFTCKKLRMGSLLTNMSVFVQFKDQDEEDKFLKFIEDLDRTSYKEPTCFYATQEGKKLRPTPTTGEELDSSVPSQPDVSEPSSIEDPACTPNSGVMETLERTFKRVLPRKGKRGNKNK